MGCCPKVAEPVEAPFGDSELVGDFTYVFRYVKRTFNLYTFLSMQVTPA